MDVISYALNNKIAAHAVSGVQSMSVNGQTLTINTKDSGVLTMTFPTPKDGVSVTDIDVNANNQIVFTMSDGSEFISGKIPTVKGEPGFSPTITENADNTDKIYKLDITTADSTFTTPNLKGADGTGGEGASTWSEISDKPFETLSTDFSVENGELKVVGGTGEENTIESISVNGINVEIDENKNVDITVPSIEGLTKDEDLATVAKSGDYEDLSNKPTIPDITGLATETYVDNKVADYTKTADLADVAISGSYNDLADKPTIPSLDGYAKTSEIPSKVSELENDSNYLSSIPEEYVTDAELESKGYLTEHQDISGKVDKVEGKSLISDAEIERLASVDNYDDTQVKTQIQAVANGLMDSVGYSADYKSIDIIAKNSEKKSIDVAPIISHASITELSDVDTTNKATGKALVYNTTTSKHEYKDVSSTDEKVKMDASTDAKYLGELLDNVTIANENGELKVKKLDGQEVSITEINYLKGLTMNVMDLVNMFSNGGVKIINTPVATYAELLTIDKSSFIEGISYLVYVLADENHDNAKTTYLVDKDSETPTYFGFADSQRDFTTNPIDLAAEITGKLGIANMDSDAIKALFTVDDTYKTETVTNNAFSTHGAKALYDELLLAIGDKANNSDLTAHKDDTDIHVSTEDRTKWDSAKTHADSAHAPSNAQENVLETVKVNGTALTPSSKAVNIDLSDYAKTTDIPTSLPADGGNSNTVNNHTVKSDVPENAVFTDTVYNDTEVKENIAELNNNLEAHTGNKQNPHGVTKSQIGLGNVENKSSATIRSELTSSNVTTALGYTPLDSAKKGAANGVAELGSDGKVPSSQLPSYVDDVLEYSSKSSFPSRGEVGKIYVDTSTNLTYRWSGSAYVEISQSLALGETSSTAYRGDRGKTAYEHSQSTHARTDATKVEKSSTNGNIKINGTETTVYKHPSGTNPHGTTKSDVGLGNVGNFKAVSTVASQGLSDTEKSNARTNIGAGTSSLTLGETSSTAYRGDKGKIAYEHSQKTSGNPHGVTKSDVGLRNVDNTADKDKVVNSLIDSSGATVAGGKVGELTYSSSECSSIYTTDLAGLEVIPSSGCYSLKRMPLSKLKSRLGVDKVDNTADKDKSVASATKATQDASGNVITDTYTTKTEFNNLEIGGRNLYIVSNSYEGYLQLSSTDLGPMNALGQEHTSEYIPVIESEKYVFQNWVTVPNISEEHIWMSYRLYDSNKALVGNRQTKTTGIVLANGKTYNAFNITIPNGVSYIRVSAKFYSDGLIKLEKGNKATDWSPAPEDYFNSPTIDNPTFTTAISMDRQSGSTVGTNSVALGSNCIASGNYSHAENNFTTASGLGSHSEGYRSKSNGQYSHAEGGVTTADGNGSHSEGSNTTASGSYSHAEGKNTTALTNQHAQGHYNNTTTATANSTDGTSTGTAFVIGNGTSNSASNAFRVTGDGSTIAKKAYSTSGADYAEYFEWEDGNVNNEDRRGLFVTTVGDKIKIANENDWILGVVSALPSVIGNHDEEWMGRYILDDFGAFIDETFEYETKEIDEETGEEVTVIKTGTKWKENTEYDKTKHYIPRSERPEWSAVGMLGVLNVVDDGTCQVNGYCKVVDGGTATVSDTGYRVIKRVTDNIIKIILK